MPTIAVPASSITAAGAYAGSNGNSMNNNRSNAATAAAVTQTAPSKQTYSHMTYSRAWLKQVALDNCQIAEQGYYANSNKTKVDISQAFAKAKTGSVHYHSSLEFQPPSELQKSRWPNTQFIVAYGSSMQVACKLVRVQAEVQHNYDDDNDNHADENHVHVGVLNSASGKTAGGKFFRGTISQEDQLCRASLLYPCLKQFENLPHHFYMVNQKPKYENSSSACSIFSPKVPIIRQDSVEATLLDKPMLNEISFCSIPAPNAFVVGKQQEEDDENNSNKNNYENSYVGNKNTTETHNEVDKVIPKAQTPGEGVRAIPHDFISLEESLQDRFHRVLSICLEHKCQALVLCAFGCGVHGNNPDSVAQIFHSLLTKEFHGCFRTVAFSIQKARPANFESFLSCFPNATIWEEGQEQEGQ
mmetsp:Transcript_18641/g.24007  ORF Transcript_18641/g.24007 Transcript_18641/m.24007 type:complete len:415 (-) Transcript_18641:173-1417(-)|eukprot:CAMPEP_0198151028 /NCGR_PEP_ID=MMETSP1443-20131203/53802_1 /TAXON_ID=186043 /ORGANISM="Entomoneis sp., Strain CCMP2396" /LENGTH=414 /DNA_ID=CAMNT_0043816549 /DNA_START=35 /DNA_END=1279 /DNA_ORIENTATION=+